MIYTNGFDSTTEEGYYVIGAAALRRGFNVILYDGPGTGRMIREKKVPYRPDWEAVLGPVMDYAETRREVDKSKIVLFGYSMGGYLCARTAAFDHRPAALVLDDGVTSFFATYPPLPNSLSSGSSAAAMSKQSLCLNGSSSTTLMRGGRCKTVYGYTARRTNQNTSARANNSRSPRSTYTRSSRPL